jgi:Na+/melibiose symporter-like transporter
MVGSRAMRLGVRGILAYSAASVGTGAFYAFNNFVISLLLKPMGAPDLVIGLLSSTRSLEGALVQPTVGAWSDRIWTRLGRRRPFMAVAIPLSALFFLLSPFATGLLELAAAIFLFSLFFNVAVDPYAALLPDVTPPAERGLVSGVSNAVQLISQVAFLVLIAIAAGGGVIPLWTYVLCGGVLLLSFGVTIAGLREPRGLAERAARTSLRTYLETLVENTLALRYLATIFVYQFGLNAILPYLTLFITQDIGESDQVALLLAALTLLVTAASAIGFGAVADRAGTGRVLAIGWALLAVAAFGGTVIHTLPETVAVVLVAGVGNGAATAVKWPLLTLLIPQEKTGVYAGLSAAADSIAIPLSVVVASELFLPTLGYRGIFAMLAINIVIALALFLAFVRVPRPIAAPAAAQ